MRAMNPSTTNNRPVARLADMELTATITSTTPMGTDAAAALRAAIASAPDQRRALTVIAACTAAVVTAEDTSTAAAHAPHPRSDSRRRASEDAAVGHQDSCRGRARQAQYVEHGLRRRAALHHSDDQLGRNRRQQGARAQVDDADDQRHLGQPDRDGVSAHQERDGEE